MATISESPPEKEDNLPITSEKGDGKTKYEVLTASPSHAEAGIITNVRLDPFGNPLQPDPTSDPLDPLNWSLVQKYVIIVIVCINYFLFTYLTTAPTLSFPLLQEQFAATYTEVNWTFAIPSLGLAVGPLFWSSFADTYGRRIVMISGTALALLSSGCTSMHDITINQYMAARFFQGFGAAPAATVGLSIIQDLSWEHERGFRVGLWVLAIGLGAPFGSLIGGFLATVDQYWVAYHVTILFAALLVLQCVFMPETLYPRALVVSSEAAGNGEKSDGTDVALPKRTKELGLIV
jgi:MFS family permease